MLIPAPTVSWGGIGAIALLAAFIVGISLNLSFGRKPECNCFGQVHSKPIGWSILVRNSVLLCGAGLVLWEQRHGAHGIILGTFVAHSGAKTAILLLGMALTTVVVRSRVILDQNFSAGLAFQVKGTPSAVLIDAKGRMASAVASGAPAVLALAKAESSRQVADAAIIYSELTSG